jgi:ornithine carbamoyltransferase
MKRDLVSMEDISGELSNLIDLAITMKRETSEGMARKPFQGKVLGLIFEKPSLRTRVSFEVGFSQLGGTSLYLSPNEIQVGKREAVKDVAKVLSRFVDIIMYRAFKNEMVRELARHADVPVINGLDDMEHPCQGVADFMTMTELKGDLKGKKLAWIGDGNNVLHSLLLGAASLGMNVDAACPKGYWPNPTIVENARRIGMGTGSVINILEDPHDAVRGADVVYTDTWVSMGDEAEKESRMMAFGPYQVNGKLFFAAKKDAIFMHCLPAHRNEEVTDEVMDSPRSAIYQQAENRMHAQKAIMVRLAGLM